MSDLLNRRTGRDMFTRPADTLSARRISKRVAASPMGAAAVKATGATPAKPEKGVS